MKKMTATREALLSHGITHDVKMADAEVESAEVSASVLREIVEAHWKDATHADMRALIRKAELALKFYEA